MTSFFTPSVGITNLPRVLELTKRLKASTSKKTTRTETQRSKNKRALSPELEKIKEALSYQMNKKEPSHITAVYKELRTAFDQSKLLKDISVELKKFNSSSDNTEPKKLIQLVDEARALIEKELRLPDKDLSSDDILDISDNIEATGVFTNSLLHTFSQIKGLIAEDGSLRKEYIEESQDDLKACLKDQYIAKDYPQEEFYSDGIRLLEETKKLLEKALEASQI